MRLNPLVALVSVALAATLLAAPAQGASGSTPAAARALADAQALFAPPASTFARRADTASRPTRDATMVLHRLSVLRDELTGDDAAAAARLLARPTDGASDPDQTGYLHPGTAQRSCTDNLCVHWVETTSDKINTRDADESGVPDYVERVADVVGGVLETYAAAGYRAPAPDGELGGDARMDIYLADVGTQGYYGFCNSDKVIPADGPHDGWAYCVLDNDYSRAEFASNTPIENLQVTAAHELFHAVQFAYDYFEDAWFMEATATWAEDELFDGVNDNLQYLSESPLGRPSKSMDRFDGYGVQQYGDWIFFRYLTERFRGSEGGMPTLVRDLWELADSAPGGAGDYSIQAVAEELRSRGTSLREVFGDFAAANRRPRASYEEGARYPTAPLVSGGRTALTKSHPGSGLLTRRVDHLASATYRFTRGFAARQLRVRVDLPPTYRGSSAVVTVHGPGKPRVLTLGLSKQGDATKRVAFGSGVSYVEVTLANGSARYACGKRPHGGYSCAGRALDDDLRMQLRATALR